MRGAKTRAPARWGEEQRDESGLEEHAVRLIRGEFAGRGDEREETQKAEDERASRPQIQDDQDGRYEANPTEGDDEVRAGGNPIEGRRVPNTRESGGALRNHAEVLTRGEKAVGADESANLANQRVEGGKIDQSKGAKEE